MDLLLVPLQVMGVVLITLPPVALIPAAGFAALAVWRRSAWCAAAAVLWLVYTAYESAMALRILCTGECNIRIDLLVIYPLLVVVSMIAIVMGLRASRGRKPAAPTRPR